MELQEKYDRLLTMLRELNSVAVAFSGGVDSAFLLYAAKEALGDSAIAITAESVLFPESEREEAKRIAGQLGARQLILQESPLDISGFSENRTNRCYLCKRELFSHMLDRIHSLGISVLVEGSNLDDEGDYRPGMQAIEELGVVSPLRMAGFTKIEIREASQQFGLPSWNKPSRACLASRIPYGDRITEEKLSMVERAEQQLYALGFSQVRVRVHGELARIEIGSEELERMMDKALRTAVSEALHACGFSYVVLDLEGYRSGSLNETIRDDSFK